MFEEIKLPGYFDAGYFDGSVTFRGVRKTEFRAVRMFELDFVTEDGGIAYIDSGVYPIRKNTFFCAKPGQKRRTDLPYNCLYIHTRIEHGSLFELLCGIPNCMAPKKPERIRELMLDLSESCKYGGTRDTVYAASRFLSLCDILGKESEALTHGTAKKYVIPDTVRKAVEYIDANYSSKLSLEIISSSVNLSPIYFHKQFLKYVGKTPNDYITEKRISAAKQMILETDAPFVDISSECGFSSQSYFNYAFKSATGKTPKEYKKSKKLQ